MNMEFMKILLKTEQLMADIKRIDNEEKAAAENLKKNLTIFHCQILSMWAK